MATRSKNEIIAKATELFMAEQFKKDFSALESTTPEISELYESGFIEKAKDYMQTTKQIQRELKQYERYVESFKSNQSTTENFNNKTHRISTMIPFHLGEAKDTGFFACGTSQSGKTTLCKHIVKTLVNEGISVYVIDVSKAWTVDTPISNVVEIPHGFTNWEVSANQSAVLDISQLGHEERISFVTSFTKELYDWHKSKGFKKAPFEFVMYEEAHVYFPNGCFRSPSKYAPCIDLVTVGANFNLRFGVITQFPAMLDKALVKITQQRYFGWSTEMNDLNYIKAFVGKEHTNSKNPNSVFNLQKGQFLYQLRSNIEKIKSSPYEQPKADFTLNGQTVSFGYNL